MGTSMKNKGEGGDKKNEKDFADRRKLQCRWKKFFFF